MPSFATFPFLARIDPATGGLWLSTSASCFCVCAPPQVRLAFSTRSRVFDSDLGGPGEWSDWSEYTYGEWGEWIAGSYPGFNTDIEHGGAEQESRVKIEAASNGVAGTLRYRQVFFEDVGTGGSRYTMFTPDDMQSADVPESGDLLIDFFALGPCSAGQTAVLVGGPGGGMLDGTGLSLPKERQAANLVKKGFREYKPQNPSAPDANSFKIFRTELVNAGSDEGCDEVDRLPRTYSGQQRYTLDPDPGSVDNAWLVDPGKVFTSTLSADLVADKHASSKFGTLSTSVDFGEVSLSSPQAKSMIEHYTCGDGTAMKFLQLVLSAEYTTTALTGAVDDALDDQLTFGGGGDFAEHFGFASITMHRHWLSPCSTRYERVRTSTFTGAVGPFDLILGSPEEEVTLACTCTEVTTDLTPGGSKITTSRVLSTVAKANDDLLVVSPGRGLATFTSIPTSNPWASLTHHEVAIPKVTVKPNAMLCVLMPTVESPEMIALGFD